MQVSCAAPVTLAALRATCCNPLRRGALAAPQTECKAPLRGLLRCAKCLPKGKRSVFQTAILLDYQQIAVQR
jgi:hypothetical protein